MSGKAGNIKPQMDELHYDIIDELYFITTFDQLLSSIGLEEQVVKEKIWELIEIQHVKAMVNYDNELELNKETFENNFRIYHYIATKKGLMWHNTTQG